VLSSAVISEPGPADTAKSPRRWSTTRSDRTVALVVEKSTTWTLPRPDAARAVPGTHRRRRCSPPDTGRLRIARRTTVDRSRRLPGGRWPPESSRRVAGRSGCTAGRRSCRRRSGRTGRSGARRWCSPRLPRRRRSRAPRCRSPPRPRRRRSRRTGRPRRLRRRRYNRRPRRTRRRRTGRPSRFERRVAPSRRRRSAAWCSPVL
jgi:hypothetical protein